MLYNCERVISEKKEKKTLLKSFFFRYFFFLYFHFKDIEFFNKNSWNFSLDQLEISTTIV